MKHELLEKVREEKNELDERIAKLYATTKSNKFEDLSAIHKMLLSKQLDAMTDYSAILAVRLELINKK